MQLNNIQPAQGAKHRQAPRWAWHWLRFGQDLRSRHKGQKSRAGGFHKVGFEGGQMPLQAPLAEAWLRIADSLRYSASAFV